MGQRTIESDGRDALPVGRDPKSEQLTQYRITLELPLAGDELWAAMRLADVTGIPVPRSRVVVYSPVGLTLDQVARLSEDEQQVRRQIRADYGCAIETIDLEAIR
jgi:hypothetical protein